MPGRSGPPRGATRPVREHVVGGLVLTGVELPLAAVAGAQDYDARQKFVVERGLPARQQSTSSLLLGLKAAVEPSPMQMHSKRREARALQLWAELERRGLAVDRVVAGALLPHVAFAVALHVMGPALVRNQVFRDEPFAADVLEAAQSGWGRLFAALRQSYASESELEEATLRPAPSLSVVTAEHRAEFPPWLDERAESPPDLVADPDLRLAISPDFLMRVEEWLFRLLQDSVCDFLQPKSPPPPVFFALSNQYRPVRDEVGLWLWQRFTLTHPDEWSDSSLLLEWRAAQGEDMGCCSRQVLQERPTDASLIADLALARQASKRGRRLLRTGLDASNFVHAAVALLQQGETQRAADIFAGLVELRPGDADALNNNGFCLIPLAPATALQSLQQAELYARRSSVINVANRVLALHLLGRDKEALDIGRRLLGAGVGTLRSRLVLGTCRLRRATRLGCGPGRTCLHPATAGSHYW